MEKRGRAATALGRGGAIERSQPVYREDKEEPEDKAELQLVL